jgi:hypothetical protein
LASKSGKVALVDNTTALIVRLIGKRTYINL